MSVLPSGEQFEIRAGRYRAVVTEVGATLRVLEANGRPLLDGFAADAMADGSRGQPLLPWPNRVLDGRYAFQGMELQLPIEEVGRHNAIHGLTRWVGWRLVAHADDRVALGTGVHPRSGYPFSLALEIEYALSADGLRVRTVATNVGQRALPFGAGQHPYLCVGTELIDDARLQFEARYVLELDPERRVPTGRTLRVAETKYDFRASRVIGGLVLDDCFGELVRDKHGIARVVLSGEYHVSLWMDSGYRWLQLFSGETLAQGKRRRGLAVEPMTCPPNAFRTEQDLIVLLPGETTTLMWGVAGG